LRPRQVWQKRIQMPEFGARTFPLWSQHPWIEMKTIVSIDSIDCPMLWLSIALNVSKNWQQWDYHSNQEYLKLGPRPPIAVFFLTITPMSSIRMVSLFLPSLIAKPPVAVFLQPLSPSWLTIRW
jgi:hypothetical protein